MSTSVGDFKIELYKDKAPATVENFLSYVNDKAYDGTIFHRVIPHFMIQGGGFTPDMKQKPTKAAIKNEAGNGLKNDLGTLAMARTSDLNSATAQFFINAKDNDFLNHKDNTTEGFGYCCIRQGDRGHQGRAEDRGCGDRNQGDVRRRPRRTGDHQVDQGGERREVKAPERCYRLPA